MKKSFVSIIVFLSLASFVPLAHCQQLNERELKVFYELSTRSGALVYDESLYTEDFDKQIARVYSEVAANNGISDEALRDIEGRAWKYGITPGEQKMLNELNNRLEALPPRLPVTAPLEERRRELEELQRIYREVADKYDISQYVLDDLQKRAQGSGQK